MDEKFIKIFNGLSPKEQKVIVDIVVIIAAKNNEIDALTKYINQKLSKCIRTG